MARARALRPVGEDARLHPCGDLFLFPIEDVRVTRPRAPGCPSAPCRAGGGHGTGAASSGRGTAAASSPAFAPSPACPGPVPAGLLPWNVLVHAVQRRTGRGLFPRDPSALGSALGRAGSAGREHLGVGVPGLECVYFRSSCCAGLSPRVRALGFVPGLATLGAAGAGVGALKCVLWRNPERWAVLSRLGAGQSGLGGEKESRARRAGVGGAASGGQQWVPGPWGAI